MAWYIYPTEGVPVAPEQTPQVTRGTRGKGGEQAQRRSTVD